LVSQNVGGTASLVRERVQEAMGGVLFIDEAYSLITNAHGIEAINQLVNDMSTYEGQFAVILAGYPNHIDELIRQNDGLARRFPTEYVLSDYSVEEMKQIFLMMVERDADNVTVGEELLEKLDTFCEAWVGGRTRNWGNAGEAQNLLTAMKKRCSTRMLKEEKAGQPLVLTPLDIPEHLQHCLIPRSKDINDALREIDQMIGLKNVKKFLKDLTRNIVWGIEGKSPGNYIFSGAPGTGKTTVARRMGEILGHLKVLRRKVNNVIECRAADLLNGSVHLTELVEDARGGILFIDEAHQLEQDERGHSIIRELVPLIEDPEIHADTCFICAGYSAAMKRFLDVDSGLSRRFPINNRIRFDDYTASELVQILELMAKARGEIVEKGYLIRSRIALEKYLEHRPENFGNGGFIRETYLPDSIGARTARLNRQILGNKDGVVTEEQVNTISQEVKRTLTEEDIPKTFVRFAGPTGQKEPPIRNAHTLLEELYGKEEVVEYVKSRYVEDDEDVFFDNNTDVGVHFSIAGPVGCGKHTTIKTIATAWKELGFLEKDEVRFVGKADLEAGFVGQTAIKTRDVIEQAMGGVLAVVYPSDFLPKNTHDNSFGPEALGTVISAMSAHFNELCVVFMDSVEGMELFLKAFPSVRSQLCRQFVIEDLLPNDMEALFHLKTSNSLAFDEEIQNLLPDFFLNWVSDRGGLGESIRAWGNGNEVEQLINELIQNWKNAKGEIREDKEASIKRRY
ncbi:MAG: AAA family ATPase, partial [Lachnospiraceae bacterium]|nr:AAA family ATPase [Lachnospiraceae bacterium]